MKQFLLASLLSAVAVASSGCHCAHLCRPCYDCTNPYAWDCYDYCQNCTRPDAWGACGPMGCGEVYWGDWCDDPPDTCEPCDRAGRYVGPHRYVFSPTGDNNGYQRSIEWGVSEPITQSPRWRR